MWCRPITALFLAHSLASLAWASEAAPFWVLHFSSPKDALQKQVTGKKVATSEKVEVYVIEEGPPRPSDPSPIPDWESVLQTCELALAELGVLAPEVTLEQPLAVLVGDFGWREPVFFSPFDKLTEADAAAFGFHSNERPILYANFPYSGDQAWRNYASLVQQLFLQLLLPHKDPFPTSFSLAAARWFSYRLAVAPVRILWGDEDHLQGGPFSWSYQNEGGWSPLFIAFIAETYGPRAAVELVLRQNELMGPYRSMLAAFSSPITEEQLFRAFLNRLWSPGSRNGWRLPFSASPRPTILAEVPASRPFSGQVRMGRGGTGLLALMGDGGKSLPLALQGDASARWLGFGRKAKTSGLADPIPIAFDHTGFAQTEVPSLAPGERFFVFLGVLPEAQGNPDERLFNLQWGLAWSPKTRVNRRLQDLQERASKQLGVLANPLRSRVMGTLRSLAGLDKVGEEGGRIVSRYAWHPGSQLVVDHLLKEARGRGLSAKTQSFLHTTPWGITAEWRNVLVELAGSGSPRLPLVLAAHWDACSDNLWESYRTAKSVKDNALGVVTALEVAAALRTQPHRLPVIVALLAGGCHNAAGAQALLASLGGKVAVWVELEHLWPADTADAAKLVAYLGAPMSTTTPRLANTFRRWGFNLEVRGEVSPPHVGAGVAEGQGALAITLAHPSSVNTCKPRVPADGELGEVSPDAALLLAGALVDLIQDLGGR